MQALPSKESLLLALRTPLHPFRPSVSLQLRAAGGVIVTAGFNMQAPPFCLVARAANRNLFLSSFGACGTSPLWDAYRCSAQLGAFLSRPRQRQAAPRGMGGSSPSFPSPLPTSPPASRRTTSL